MHVKVSISIDILNKGVQVDGIAGIILFSLAMLSVIYKTANR